MTTKAETEKRIFGMAEPRREFNWDCWLPLLKVIIILGLIWFLFVKFSAVTSNDSNHQELSRTSLISITYTVQLNSGGSDEGLPVPDPTGVIATSEEKSEETGETSSENETPHNQTLSETFTEATKWLYLAKVIRQSAGQDVDLGSEEPTESDPNPMGNYLIDGEIRHVTVREYLALSPSEFLQVSAQFIARLKLLESLINLSRIDDNGNEGDQVPVEENPTNDMGEIDGETREEDELIENQDPELNRFSLSARGDVASPSGAVLRCFSKGMRLASIESMEDAAALESLLQGNKEEFWTSGIRDGDGFQWSRSGNRVDGQYWPMRHDNDEHGGKFCLALLLDSDQQPHQLAPATCFRKMRYICQTL